MTEQSEFEWDAYDPQNRLTRTELATILALDQLFVVDRIERSETFSLKFNDTAFLECLANCRAFLDQFAAAARYSERHLKIFNLRIRLRPDCMFEAYLDEGWRDLIGIEALELDQALNNEAALAPLKSLDVLAIELLQSAWCQLSLDAQLHIRQGLLETDNTMSSPTPMICVNDDSSVEAENNTMMRLN